MTSRFGRAVLAALFGVMPAIAVARPPEAVRVAVLDHPVARGDVLTPTDFTEEERSVAQARGALSARDCAGMEARRALPTGSIVLSSDLMPQQLVHRGEPVMIHVVNGGLTIAASGRALSSGAKGDMVRVVTNTTSRTIDGIVDAAGSVRIVAP